MHILVTSPIPSHPQNHGNRARVHALCRALQARGAVIHYVYGGLEDLAPENELLMRQTWDHVHVLPPVLASERIQSHRHHYLLDDWYNEAVTDVVRRIIDVWRIDYCIANYVWFSKWLAHVPAGIPKYIDTHDIFGGRHKILKAGGLEPNWFFTTKEEEGSGLARADKVIAIQSEEARQLQTRAAVPVVTLGHFVEPDFLPSQAKAGDRKRRVGYLASDNPINQQSLVAFDAALAARPDLVDRYEFLLAGGICSSDAAAETQFRRLGYVDSTRGFYGDVDVIINPNIGGTGLKIKSIEALAHGKALLATRDAMAGLETSYEGHQHADAAAICDTLSAMDVSPEIARAEDAARVVIDGYQASQRRALNDLFPDLFPRVGEPPIKGVAS